MKLYFVGADHEVTGSCHVIEVNGKYVMLENEELENFMTAVRSYFELAKHQLYC